MCSTPSLPAPVTPAAAPAPAAPAAAPVQIGKTREQQNIATGGTVDGPTTRVDRTANANGTGPGVGGNSGSGLNI